MPSRHAVDGLLATFATLTLIAPPPPDAAFKKPMLRPVSPLPEGHLLVMDVRNKGSGSRLAVSDLKAINPAVLADNAVADTDPFK